MTLAMNLVRTILSAKFIFAAVDEILGAIFASHTHRNVPKQPKY